MCRLLSSALILAAGVSLGWLARTPDRRPPCAAATEVVPYAGPITIQKEHGVWTTLKPHAITHTGSGRRSTKLGPVPEGAPVWVVTFDDGRVIVGCTEEGGA